MSLDLEKMTVEDLSVVLNIHEETLKKLAKTRQIPSISHKNRLYFNFSEVLQFFKKLEGSI